MFSLQGQHILITLGITFTKNGNAQGQQSVVLTFFNTEEGYIEPQFDPVKTTKIVGYNYTYQYKDHLGNIRLSYEDMNGDGVISAETEIKEENHYYRH